MRNKLQLGQNAWDKSPCRMKLTDKFPSFTSLTRLIHPIENRDLYIREYAHIMGYPDDFIFYPDCKVNPVQCIAQGVPVNFIRYISNEIKNSFTTNEFIDGNIIYILNQGNGKVSEYDDNGILKFEGEYLNGEKNGKGKEYNSDDELKFVEYLNGERNLQNKI